MRIAVNKDDIEQVYITELVCRGKNVQVLEMSYVDSYIAFVRKQVDLLVSRFESGFAEKYHVRYEGLSHFNCDVDSTTPVIVVNKENYGIAKLIRNIINPKEIGNIQQQVITGQIDPSVYY